MLESSPGDACCFRFRVKRIKGVFGTVRIEAYRRYLPPALPVPDTSVRSVRHQHHFGKFRTTSIPAPDTSVSSVRQQYRYQMLRKVRYDINTGTGHFGKFGTTSVPFPPLPLWTSVPGLTPDTTAIPVPNTSECSVKQYPVPGTSSVRSVRHQNHVPPRCDIKLRLILMRSDSKLQIFAFRCDEWIGLLILCSPILLKPMGSNLIQKSDGPSQLFAQNLTTRSIGFSNRNGIGLLIK